MTKGKQKWNYVYAGLLLLTLGMIIFMIIFQNYYSL